MSVPTQPPAGSTGTPEPAPTNEGLRALSPAALQTRGATLAVTNITKLAGVGLAINEMALRADLRPLAVALCGVMLLGAQLSEDLVLKAIDRFLGNASPPS